MMEATDELEMLRELRRQDRKFATEGLKDVIYAYYAT